MSQFSSFQSFVVTPERFYEIGFRADASNNFEVVKYEGSTVRGKALVYFVVTAEPEVDLSPEEV